MGIFIAGLVIFFAVHSVSIVSDEWRNRMAARLGEGPWQGLYSVISLVGFALIVWGYGLARQQPAPIYVPPMLLRHVTMFAMIPVFPLLVATYAPGSIKSSVQHPMLLAVMLWGAAHLLANGSLADILLFGSFLVWAAADRISMSRRIQRPLPGLSATKFNDLIAVVVGLATYFAFVFWLHGWLFGAPLAGRV